MNCINCGKENEFRVCRKCKNECVRLKFNGIEMFVVGTQDGGMTCAESIPEEAQHTVCPTCNREWHKLYKYHFITNDQEVSVISTSN